MSAYQARRWIILASLLLAGLSVSFFVLAPVFEYPLRYSQAQSLWQLVLPVFLGYLGAASQFVFQKETASHDITLNPLASLLIRGPIVLFVLLMTVAILAFGYSNRITAAPGSGMSIDLLSNVVTSALGLLAVTTNVAVAYLFSIDKKQLPDRKP